jgi:hypothetical protein
MSRMWQIVADHITLAASGTAALLILAGIMKLWQRFVGEGFPGPIPEPDTQGKSTKTVAVPTPVNVEILDASKKLLDPGPYIIIRMHNTMGNAYEAVGGVFLGCNPAWIRPGTLVHLNIQDGKVHEDLVVIYDQDRKTLYVQSAFTTAEILAKIHKAPEPVI